MEINPAWVIAFASVIASGLGFLAHWVAFSDRITKAQVRGDAAGEEAAAALVAVRDTRRDLEKLAERFSLITAEVSLYRLETAREYVHRDVMKEVEERLTNAIDRAGAQSNDAIKGLGDRLDRFLEERR